MERRITAIAALACGAVGGALLVVAAALNLSSAIVFALLAVVSTVLAWIGVIHTGWIRTTSWTVASVALIGSLAFLFSGKSIVLGTTAVVLISVGLGLAKRAYSIHVELPYAPAPRKPVMLYNPRSGGGVASKVNLAVEAQSRGITPIELVPGSDVRQVLEQAIAHGADGLMAAGGDGTQALVAHVAADHDLPFACVPAGTRNHFALDLGVDRADVVGALDAFVNGGEKRVDLAEVNGHVFVNNVSIGVYAEAVQRESYRSSKVRTLLRTIVEARPSAGNASTAPLRWTGPDGRPQEAAPIVLVANNVYRLGTAIGSGTRPRLDQGTLGVTVIGAAESGGRGRTLVSEWAAPQFVVETVGDVPIGLDGEAATLPAPLRFASRPSALRVRISPLHPGASPSAGQPNGPIDGVRLLARLAFGSNQRTPGDREDHRAFE